MNSSKPMSAATSPFEEPAGVGRRTPLHKAMLQPRDRDLQRAKGVARLVLANRGGQTYAADVFQKSPLRVLFPRIGGRAPDEAVLANTAGGIAGGDEYVCDIIAGANAAMTITTQAAEKVYRALDAPASVVTSLKAVPGAQLAWLPQETILFDGARLHRSTRVELAPGAELLALEWLVLGRAARGETMGEGEVTDSWRVHLGARLIWADTLRLSADAWPHLNRAVLLDRCTALATLIYFGPRAEGKLDSIRATLATLPCRSGVTETGGLAVMRFAAPAPADLRVALRGFLQQFGIGHAASPFRVPKMWSC
jgi:urease accessory protein